MDNISNLNLLISILLNGMLIVFLVLSLIFFIGKLIIQLFSSINPSNHIIHYAMASNISGVIGSAVAAGILITFFG